MSYQPVSVLIIVLTVTAAFPVPLRDDPLFILHGDLTSSINSVATNVRRQIRPQFQDLRVILRTITGFLFQLYNARNNSVHLHSDDQQLLQDIQANVTLSTQTLEQIERSVQNLTNQQSIDHQNEKRHLALINARLGRIESAVRYYFRPPRTP